MSVLNFVLLPSTILKDVCHLKEFGSVSRAISLIYEVALISLWLILVLDFASGESWEMNLPWRFTIIWMRFSLCLVPLRFLWVTTEPSIVVTKFGALWISGKSSRRFHVRIVHKAMGWVKETTGRSRQWLLGRRTPSPNVYIGITSLPIMASPLPSRCFYMRDPRFQE